MSVRKWNCVYNGLLPFCRRRPHILTFWATSILSKHVNNWNRYSNDRNLISSTSHLPANQTMVSIQDLIWDFCGFDSIRWYVRACLYHILQRFLIQRVQCNSIWPAMITPQHISRDHGLHARSTRWFISFLSPSFVFDFTSKWRARAQPYFRVCAYA